MAPQSLERSGSDDSLDSIRDEEWQRLDRSTIVFSHHSVGRNILAGVSAIAAQRAELTLPIVGIEPGDEPAGPGLFHVSTGENGDPASKLDGFAAVMATPLGARADIAICKLCYADIGPGVAADPVFEIYRTALAALADRHPKTSFVHPTIPLRTPPGVKSRAKGLVRGLLGRTVHPDPNRARNRYNERLRAEFADGGEIFDIAGLESTRADGSRVVDTRGPGPVHAMAAEWTDDGGHLSVRGQRHVASAFLALLARLAP